jgi:hypothetical protein
VQSSGLEEIANRFGLTESVDSGTEQAPIVAEQSSGCEPNETRTRITEEEAFLERISLPNVRVTFLCSIVFIYLFIYLFIYFPIYVFLYYYLIAVLLSLLFSFSYCLVFSQTIA